MSNLPGPVTRFRFNALLPGASGKDGAAGPAGPTGPSGAAAGQQTNTLANGLNSNIPTGGQPTVRVIGPTAAFSVGGFDTGATPAAGATLTLINTTAQPMTVVHEDTSSTAAHRIDTQSGAPVLLPPRRGRLTFTYDGTSSRWVLVESGINYQKWIDVRDFGAIGDGVTDDTAACQAALTYAKSLASQFNSVLPPAGLFPSGFVCPTVYFPRGVYHLTASANQACLEVAETIRVIGDGYGTMLVPSTANAHCFRVSGLYNKIEDMAILQGLSAVVFNGPSRYYGGGELGNALYNGLNVIRNVYLQGQAGPSIWQDISLSGRDGSYGCLVEGCFIITSCAYLGFIDEIHFEGCWFFLVQKPIGPGNSFCPPVNDDNGLLLPFITSFSVLHVNRCIGTPISDPTRTPRGGWLGGGGIIRANDTRFGGESIIPVAVNRTSFVYKGINWKTVVNGEGEFSGSWHFNNCAMASCDAVNWMEIYDAFPTMIDVRQTPASTNTGFTAPQSPILLMQSYGIWVDATSCPTSTFLDLATDAIVLNFEPRTVYGTDFRIRTSTDQTKQLGQPGVTDLTAQLRRYMQNAERQWGAAGGLQEQANLWPAGKLQLSQADNAAGTFVGGSNDTSTGYTIGGFQGPTGGGFCVAGFDNVFTPSTPAGEYTLSFLIKAQFAGQVVTQITDAVGGGNGVPYDVSDFSPSGNGWQRIEVCIYWKGTTFSGGTSAGIRFQINGIPQTSNFWVAFFSLEPGRKATDRWHYPGNANQSNLVVDRTYAAGPPVTGTYKQGDQIQNINANAPGQPSGWYCIRAGSFGGAGSAAPLFAPLSVLTFDPNEIVSYNFDYDASTLTPGAITAWPSKFGGTDTIPRFQVNGTATAHAAGGTGPNGAAYVSGNGTSDILTEGNQSLTVAKELWLVAKYDSAFASSSFLWDGGAGNQGVILRTAAHTFTILNTISGATVANETSWNIWHIIADGTNVTLEINGVVVATAAGGTSFLDGITMFSFATGSNYAAASIARAIGFYAPITSAQSTQMYAYLSTLYGIQVSGSGGSTSLNEASQAIAAGQVITAGVSAIVAQVTLTAGPSGMVEVIGSCGPGGATQSGWTSQTMGLFYNTAGGGLDATKAVGGQTLDNTGAALFGGASAIVSNLTPGTAYDFYLMEVPTGGDFHTTGISVNQKGGIYARAL